MNVSMMQFDGVAAIFAVIGLLCLMAGYKLLSSSSWIGGWLRGNIGILCVVLTGFFGLCVMDLRSYKPMFDDQTVATVSFREISKNQYEVRIVDAMGIENRYSIAGDSWYLSGNQFKWSKRLSLGLGHGYRFHTISGHYTKIAGAETKDALLRSRYFDVWKFVNSYAPANFLVTTGIIVTVAQPLADAAMYEVVPSGVDLIVKPLNEFAKRALMDISQPDASQSAAANSEVKLEPVSSPISEVVPAAAQQKPALTQ